VLASPEIAMPIKRQNGALIDAQGASFGTAHDEMVDCFSAYAGILNNLCNVLQSYK